MKKFITLSILMLAFITNAKAWEPVIKETHWFGILEYDGTHVATNQETGESWIADDYGANELHYTLTLDGSNQIKSIQGYYDWHQGSWGRPHPSSTFNCWMDDSGDDPKPRFRVNRNDVWSIGKNSNTDYRGQGLKLNVDRNGGSCLWIQHLQANDRFIIEYYLDSEIEGDYAQAFLAEQDGCASVTNRTAKTSCDDDSKLVSGTEYTCSDGGNVSINFPGGTVIRGITIIYNSNNYKKATTRIDEITETINGTERKGYEMTITGSGVLEDKRGAVPYITMRYGAEDDMTFSKYLGTAYGAKRYGTASIVDESEELDPNKVELQSQFRDRTEEANKKTLVGKEWTVFTQKVNLSGDDNFNSIYPLYGNYFYFFPEVNGRLKMRFYCEGDGEHMAFWYKQKGDEFIPATAQPTPVSTTPDDLEDSHNSNGSNYYEYVFDVEKDGVYYLCSNPTISTQQLPIPRLISYAFIPTFRVDPLYKVVADVTENTGVVDKATTIYGGTAHVGEISSDPDDETYGTMEENKETIPLVKCLGNIKKAVAEIYNGDGEKQYLKIKNIEYKEGTDVNKGGAVVVHINCEAGEAAFVLTVAYDAVNKNPDGTAVTTEVKKWDFYSGVGDGIDGGWDLGKYGEDDDTRYADAPDEWKDKSKLFKEVHKADGLTADWVDTYVNITETNETKKERIFKSVYDMEGDNADMIHETAGLVFHTHANLLGILNENDAPKDAFQDRYIGLMPGSKFSIPFLEKGDRIVMKMGTYGNLSTAPETTTLNISNVYDATGKTEITGDYVIGGSAPVSGDVKDANNNYVPRGEYHFVVKSDGDVDFEVTAGQLLKVYTIEIYRNAKNNNADIITENEIKGDLQKNKRYILNTEDGTKDNAVLHLNYRGLNELVNYEAREKKTGNIVESELEPSCDHDDETNDYWYTYSVTKGTFGVFKSRLGVNSFKNTDEEAYVTDYADCMIPVGYLETMTYPYTWDFTDLKKYVNVKNTTGNEGNVIETYDGIDASGDELNVTEDDLKIWDKYGFRTNSDEYDGYIFAPGGQLYGGTTMFDETRGIGIFHNEIENKSMTMNGSADATDGGLTVSEEFGFVVPKVAKKQAIYVHATPAGDTQSATFAIGNGEAKPFTYAKDGIFAMQMADNATTANVTLNFKGYEVNKIAVATDEKKTNIKGYASESRDHAIDASLLPYFTGKAMKSYLVSNPNYEEHTLTLTDVSNTESYVIPANTGYVIYNPDNANDTGEFNPFWDGKEATVADKGFHLFVPDMHDDEEAEGKFAGVETNNDFMVPVLEERTGDNKLKSFSSDGKKTNYVLSYKWYDLKPDGSTTGQPHTGDEMFYRVSKEGINLRANSAYLVLDTESLGLKTSQGSIQGSTQSAKFTFVFSDWSDEPVVPTTIENHGTMETFENGNVEWHNLRGQKLNGKPSVPGLYIVNGKKVLVK